MNFNLIISSGLCYTSVNQIGAWQYQQRVSAIMTYCNKIESHVIIANRVPVRRKMRLLQRVLNS